MPIGDRIRALRKAKGLNQTELGNRLGVKTNAVSKWECGRVEDIPMSKVKAMAALFNVPVSYLMDEEQAPTDPGKRAVSDEEMMFALWGDTTEVDEADLDDVRRYAAFIKERKKKE